MTTLHTAARNLALQRGCPPAEAGEAAARYLEFLNIFVKEAQRQAAEKPPTYELRTG